MLRGRRKQEQGQSSSFVCTPKRFIGKMAAGQPLFRIAEQMPREVSRTCRGESKEVNVTQAMRWHTNLTNLGVYMRECV